MKSSTPYLLPYRGGRRNFSHRKLKKAFNKVRVVVQKPIDKAQEKVEDFGEDFQEDVLDAGQENIEEGISSGKEKIEDFGEDFQEDVLDAGGEAIQDALDVAGEQIQSGLDSIKGFGGDIWGWIKGALLWVLGGIILFILLIVFLVKGIGWMFRGKAKPAVTSGG